MREIKYTWDDIISSCNDIANFFREKEIATIIGIARGGIIPGSIVASLLGANFTTISAKSYTGRKRSRLKISSSDIKFDISRNALIVDDICDSGHTLKGISEFISLLCDKHVYTATVIKKPNDVFEPTYSTYTNVSDEWVVFPWEND